MRMASLISMAPIFSEHADPRQGYQPDWHSFLFNYGRHEVRFFSDQQCVVLA